ncbi:MAG: DNA polymerase IV [Candidatus Paceibacterota bacterium]
MDPRAQSQDFPRAILHVDGDAFFVSCELARRPDLRGKAAVTGEERGIATALNPAAKALGVIRGMRTRDIRRLHPEVVIMPSDYHMYTLYTRRMYEIVRRYADSVEEYSIDECFADLTPYAAGHGPYATLSYEELARLIQADLHASLGITFSVGLGVNKVTAKIASKWRKPAGVTVIARPAIHAFLKDLPIGKVWGIGSATTVYLRKLGIVTAGDLAGKDRAWVAEHCDRPVAEIYEEFQGNFVKEFGVGSMTGTASAAPGSVQHTRTFHPPTRERAFLWSQISHHVEEACVRLRARGLVAARATCFVKTRDFDYIRGEAELPEPSSAPEAILRALKPVFEARYRGDLMYRAAGISLSGLRAPEAGTQGLFAVPAISKASQTIHAVIDRLSRKFGRRAAFLGSSHKALKAEGDDHEADFRKLDVIYMGEVG